MALKSASPLATGALRDGALPTGAEKHREVREMFDRIAPRYDFMNRLMTGGLDQRWRRDALALIDVGPGDRVLDVACGTGDLTELARARGARVVGLDFAGEMLRGARARDPLGDWMRCDAARLPFRDASASAVVSGFALRNFVSIPEVLAELARVLEPGGRIALIDASRPDNGLLRMGHALYFERLVPKLGAWLADEDAYAYLPRSMAYLPPARELADWILAAGFERPERRLLGLGAVQLWTAVRRSTGASP